MILLVMTLIGVTAIRVTSLEERMAGNTQDQYLSFQQAETALRDGEDDLVADIESGSPSLTYLFPSTCWGSSPSGNCWDLTSTSWSSERYILEDLGSAPINRDCLDLDDLTTCYIKVYRTTGQGAGQLAGTLSMVQSVVKLIE